MAEALTLIGGLAAIMQLSGSMIQLTRTLRKCVDTICSAPKEIESFILETSIFTAQLGYFHSLTKEFATRLNQNYKTTRADLIRKIARQCELVKDGFAHFVQRFVEINNFDHDSNLAPFHTPWARFLWLWKKPDIPELRLSIQSAISNLVLLSSCFQLEEKIETHGKNDEIKMLKWQLQDYKLMAAKLRDELAKRQNRKHPSERSPKIDDLEKYVDDMIHSQEPLIARLPNEEMVPVVMTEHGIVPARPLSSHSANERLKKKVARARSWIVIRGRDDKSTR